MNDSPVTSAPRVAHQATAREFMAILFRRKWIVLGLFLITTATVTTVALTTPTTYQSSGRILVKRGERQSALRADRQIFDDWEQDLGSEMQVMKSQPVVQRARDLVAEQAKREHTAIVFNPKKIDVEVVGKSNVIALGYTDLDPSTAQIACRSLMQAYVEYHREKLFSDRPQHYFTEEINALTRSIDSLSNARLRYTEHSGMAAPATQTQAWLVQMASLQNRRSDLAAEFAQAQSVEQTMHKLMDDPDVDLPTFDGGAVFTNESALVTLKQRVVEQQLRIATLSETMRDDAQEVVAARQTLETLQGMLRKEVEQRVRLAASRTQSLQAKVDVLDGEIATLRQQLDTTPQNITTVDDMDAQLITLRNRLREITARQDEAAVTANTMVDVNVVVLAPASIAEAINALDPVRLGLAPAFSLLVGIAIAFFIDGLDLTVRTANQAEEYLDLPVLASIGERRRRHS
jgi:succinoglycan biosynthesis transport protein ExoP